MRKAFEKVLALYRKIRSRKSLDIYQRARKAIRVDRRETSDTQLSNIPNSLDRPRHDVKLPLSLFKRKGSVQGVPLRSTAPPRQLHRACDKENTHRVTRQH